MLSSAENILVATRHEELAAAVAAAGGRAVDSIADLEAALKNGGVRGVVVCQDVPHLSPDLVRQWAAQGLRTAVWLEDNPPPAWRALAAVSTVWRGELDEETLQRWIDEAAGPADFAASARVLGVLGLGADAAAVAVAWAGWLRQRRGEGLAVDADWREAGLTERAAAHVWDRAWDYAGWHATPAHPVPLVPAPPPWEAGPRNPGSDSLHSLERRGALWLLVHLGHEFRQPPGSYWLPRLEALVLVHDATRRRVAGTVGVLREMRPQLQLGLVGRPLALDGVQVLGQAWPQSAALPPARGLFRWGERWRRWLGR
jgi:hypothetical protein